MASYKDTAPLQFSPYVSTIPVEAMAKVGMYRQKRYDEGVQKIQESIDNVAGLDIVRPEDKKYLQSKLNQLGSQLSMVAGGDFSNFALVNSVNGMTNQIAKDPRILKDVSSSVAYKKALETRTKLIEQGKGSASNDMLFNEQVNAWMNGGENASFNSTYRPYSDYEAKKREIIKTLTAEKIGQPVIYGPNGKLLSAMTYTEVEELSPQKILTALKQGLSPDEYEQLQIDGRYKYSNVSEEQFASDVNSRFTSAYSELSKDRANLMRQMEMLKDVNKKEAYNIEINKISNEMSNLKQQYETTSESFLKGDVESAKARLYTNDWFNDSANVYKYKNVKQEYSTNPALADQRRLEEMNRADARAKAALDQQWNIKMYELDLKREEKRLEEGKISQEEFSKRKEELERITVTRAGTGDDEPPKPDEVIETVKKERNALKANSEALKSTIVQMVDSQFDEGTNDEKFNSAIKAYNDNSTLIKDQVKIKIAEYLQNERLLNNKNNSINLATDYANNVVERTDYNSEIISDLRDEGYTDNDVITLYPKGYSYEGRGKQGEEYQPIGEGYNYTVDEIVNSYVEFENSNVSIDKHRADDLDNLDAISKYTKKPIFTPKEKEEILKLTKGGRPELLNLYKLYKKGEMGKSPFAPESKKLSQLNSSIKRKINKINKEKEKEDKEYNEAFVNKLKESYIVDEPINITIPTDKAGEPEALRTKLLVLENENRLDKTVIDIGDDSVDASSIMNAESAYLRRAMDGNYKLFYATKNGKLKSLDITMQQAIENFPDQVSVPNQYNEFDALFTPMMLQNKNPIITREIPQEDKDGNVLESLIVKTQAPLTYYTTATDGKFNTTPENAALKQYDFPSVSSFEVTGNIVSLVKPTDADNQEVFSLQINVKDPITGEYILKNSEITPSTNKATVINSKNQLTDEVIIGYIESQKREVQRREEELERIRKYMNLTQQ
jgi:hypothetical protein